MNRTSLRTGLLLGLLLLSSCATPTPGLWTKLGATPEDFARDRYVCLQESRTSWQGQGLIGMAVAQGHAQELANRLAHACMEARGYHFETVPEAP